MPLKLIQVGLGMHGRGVAGQYVVKSPDFIYAGLVDIDRATVENFAVQHELPKTPFYSDFRQAFGELKADAVLVTAASPVHYEVCRTALENGLHVLVEKPFVISIEHGLYRDAITCKRGLLSSLPAVLLAKV